MTNTNATNFRRNAFSYFDQAIQFNDIINVTTKNGNAVVMSEGGLQRSHGDVLPAVRPRHARAADRCGRRAAGGE